VAPMPPAWCAVEDGVSGDIYFYHDGTGRTTWEHPADRHYKSLAREAMMLKYGVGSRQVASLPRLSSDEDTDSDSDMSATEQEEAYSQRRGAAVVATERRPVVTPRPTVMSPPTAPARPSGRPRLALAPNRARSLLINAQGGSVFVVGKQSDHRQCNRNMRKLPLISRSFIWKWWML
jgi:hypothetical protein